ncbi:MAG: nicotinate (nicotinamide) nucleotide adenylyltransferase [archaeon]
MRVGLFGGSFNPIHNEHLRMLRYILDRNIADEVWVMPCKMHAFNKDLIPPNDRVKMIKLAIKDIPNTRVCMAEINSEGKNYTADTIKRLKAKYKHDFRFIIGFDILTQIEKWYKHTQLFKETEFIVFRRKGYHFKKIKGMKIASVIEWKEKKISSTMIRERIKNKKSITRMVPSIIADYIGKNKLYR